MSKADATTRTHKASLLAAGFTLGCGEYRGRTDFHRSAFNFGYLLAIYNSSGTERCLLQVFLSEKGIGMYKYARGLFKTGDAPKNSKKLKKIWQCEPTITTPVEKPARPIRQKGGFSISAREARDGIVVGKERRGKKSK